MITQVAASATCRAAAARICQSVADVRVDLADNDYWACDHPGATESEIYAAGVVDGLGGEAGDFAALWTPAVALAFADVLDGAARLIDTLPPGMGMGAQMSLTVRVAEALLGGGS